ncbi:hypothetical protein [Gemmata sp.]|uniref:hypothetical protein n=1 Tax=Gemmata sp. TaxID=1914242 RepID=UPI003F71BAF5
MRIAATLGLLALLGTAAAADDKIDLKKIVGKWEHQEKSPGGAVWVTEFTDKGKLVVHVSPTTKLDGTYKILEGGKVETKLSLESAVEQLTWSVKKLTDDELVLESDLVKPRSYKRKK